MQNTYQDLITAVQNKNPAISPKLEGGKRFQMKTEFKPAGDQPEAINQLVNGANKEQLSQVLLGVTGSGKTFTMAKVIEKTKWMILNSPSNPTGAGYTKKEVQDLAKVLIKNKKVHILSDDIYEHIKYDDFNFYTIAQNSKLKDRTLTMNGVSKSYSMTGWRIGYAAGPKEIIKAIGKIQSQSTSNPSSISQAAAVEALNGNQGFIKKRSKAFKERRDFVVKSLNKIKGINCLTPNGAFYVFPSCKGLLNKKTKLKTDTEFVQKLLEKSNVAVVQGSAFGLDGYFRISYATSMQNLKKAMDRIKSFCESLS